MVNSTLNPYFTQGTAGEQNLVQDLIIESLRIYGKEFYYIPRTLVSKDSILGEDRLSKFMSSYPIEMYFENVDSYGGDGAFIQKFGLMMEQQATLVVARRRWEKFIGRYGKTIIPDRPCEGDLIWFPLSNNMFEIKFVKHQDPFYQLGKLYVYKLQVELFQYASEQIDTGIPEIDAFETLKTFNTDTTRSGQGAVVAVTMTNQGSGYTSIPSVVFTPTNGGSGASGIAVLGTGSLSQKVIRVDITSGGAGYMTAPHISFTGGGGINAAATCSIVVNTDNTYEHFGDNNKFKKESIGIINFDESNPFGELSNTYIASTVPALSTTADSLIAKADSTTITADIV
jgi:hypothetical protein